MSKFKKILFSTVTLWAILGLTSLAVFIFSIYKLVKLSNETNGRINGIITEIVKFNETLEIPGMPAYYCMNYYCGLFVSTDPPLTCIVLNKEHLNMKLGIEYNVYHKADEIAGFPICSFHIDDESSLETLYIFLLALATIITGVCVIYICKKINKINVTDKFNRLEEVNDYSTL